MLLFWSPPPDAFSCTEAADDAWLAAQVYTAAVERRKRADAPAAKADGTS